MTRWALAAALVLASPLASLPRFASAAGAALDVPIVEQEPRRCGPAALEMVLRFWGADSAALGEARRAYDPVLRGALITDLAAAARRGGFAATVADLTPDSLAGLLASGVPPIVLFQAGRPPLTTPHYGVVTAWDPVRATFTLNEGRARPRVMRRAEFVRRWGTAGSRALVVTRGAP